MTTYRRLVSGVATFALAAGWSLAACDEPRVPPPEDGTVVNRVPDPRRPERVVVTVRVTVYASGPSGPSASKLVTVRLDRRSPCHVGDPYPSCTTWR